MVFCNLDCVVVELSIIWNVPGHRQEIKWINKPVLMGFFSESSQTQGNFLFTLLLYPRFLYLSFWLIRSALLLSVFYCFDSVTTPGDSQSARLSFFNTAYPLRQPETGTLKIKSLGVFLLHFWPIAYYELILRIRIFLD